MCYYIRVDQCSECELRETLSSLRNQIFILPRKKKATNKQKNSAPQQQQKKQPQTKKGLTIPKQTASIKRIQFNSNEGYRPDRGIDIKFFMIYGLRVSMKLT